MKIVFTSKLTRLFKSILRILQDSKCTMITLHITPSGITVQTPNNSGTTLFDIFLNAKSFTQYILRKSIHITINVQHINQVLFTVKKDHILSLSYSSRSHPILHANILKTQSHQIKSNIHVQRSKFTNLRLPINLPQPTTYCSPINIKTSDFKSTIKDFTNLSKSVNVSATEQAVKLSCTKGNIFDCEYELITSEFDDNKIIYQSEINSELFARIFKIPLMVDHIQFHVSQLINQQPIWIRFQLDKIGYMSIYISPL